MLTLYIGKKTFQIKTLQDNREWIVDTLLHYYINYYFNCVCWKAANKQNNQGCCGLDVLFLHQCEAAESEYTEGDGQVKG